MSLLANERADFIYGGTGQFRVVAGGQPVEGTGRPARPPLDEQVYDGNVAFRAVAGACLLGHGVGQPTAGGMHQGRPAAVGLGINRRAPVDQQREELRLGTVGRSRVQRRHSPVVSGGYVGTPIQKHRQGPGMV